MPQVELSEKTIKALEKAGLLETTVMTTVETTVDLFENDSNSAESDDDGRQPGSIKDLRYDMSFFSREELLQLVDELFPIDE